MTKSFQRRLNVERYSEVQESDDLKVLTRRDRKAMREWVAKIGAMPAGKRIQRHPTNKSLIKGEPSEDREEWTEEVREHCCRYYDEVGESSDIHREERGGKPRWTWYLLRGNGCRKKNATCQEIV